MTESSMAIKIPEGRMVFTDIDDTLILWDSLKEAKLFDEMGREDLESVIIKSPSGFEVRARIYAPNIEKIKKLKLCGYIVVAWSMGGSNWAEAVCKGIGMDPYVDAYLTKPRYYFDDMPVATWIGKRRFINPDGSEGAEGQ